MPYYGTKVPFNNQAEFIIRLHGPLDLYSGFDFGKLKEAVKDFLTQVHPGDNLINSAEQLAKYLRDKYCDGHDLLWTQVEVLISNDIIFGTTAENILT